MMTKNVKEDNFDIRASSIKINEKATKRIFLLEVYFIAILNANKANRKLNNSSLDFILFMASVCIGWIKNKPIVSSGSNQWYSRNILFRIKNNIRQVAT